MLQPITLAFPTHAHSPIQWQSWQFHIHPSRSTCVSSASDYAQSKQTAAQGHGQQQGGIQECAQTPTSSGLGVIYFKRYSPPINLEQGTVNGRA